MLNKYLFLFFVQFSLAQVFKTYNFEKGELKSFENYASLEKYIQPKEGELLVINFWATWCEPCVAEIPYFNQMISEYKRHNVRLIFISLDFNKLLEKRLIPFLNQNEMLGEALHLADSRQNVWIDQVDKDWSGAIPATIFLSTKHKFLYEGELSLENLIKFVNDFKL